MMQIRLGNFGIKMDFLWYDFWIGWYYDRAHKAVYICPLPMCVIKIWKDQDANGWTLGVHPFRPNMKKVVIAGSASLQDRVAYWEQFWKSHNYTVTVSPREISRESYLRDYPAIHTGFYTALSNADILFVMNEDKNDMSGYIGAETFAELAYVVANKLLGKQQTQTMLLKMPGRNVQSYEEIMLWHQLGWIQLFDTAKI